MKRARRCRVRRCWKLTLRMESRCGRGISLDWDGSGCPLSSEAGQEPHHRGQNLFKCRKSPRITRINGRKSTSRSRSLEMQGEVEHYHVIGEGGVAGIEAAGRRGLLEIRNAWLAIAVDCHWNVKARTPTLVHRRDARL